VFFSVVLTWVLGHESWDRINGKDKGELKKLTLLLLVIVVLASSCKPLDRLNPTDPKSSNYEGITYKGEFGDFSGLQDIAIMNNNIFACDDVQEKISWFSSEGSLLLDWINVSGPGGICGDGRYLYVVRLMTGQKYMVVYDTQNPETGGVNYLLSDTASQGIALSGSSVYITAPAAYKVYKYTTGGTALTWWGSQGSGNGQFETISDIETHSSGEVVVADSQLNRITIFDSSGNLLRTINVDSAIKGIGLHDDTISAATANGVYEISYATGAVIRVWGTYGEGGGKVTAPGLTESCADFTLVAMTDIIKKFAP
jgi:hypothetical protein